MNATIINLVVKMVLVLVTGRFQNGEKATEAAKQDTLHQLAIVNRWNNGVVARIIYGMIDARIRAERSSTLAIAKRMVATSELKAFVALYPEIYRSVIANRMAKISSSQSKSFKAAKSRAISNMVMENRIDGRALIEAIRSVS